ncbi:MAG: AAA family ATPase [Saprospiraceae bacterium]|nr:AAA family ATPase [Saprospiraceae bacterium]
MIDELIGRVAEKKILTTSLASQGAEFIAVVGRRRVGKTFLINQVYDKQIVFQITGIQNGKIKQQLRNFRDEFKSRINNPERLPPPSDWLEAFQLLKEYLTPLMSPESKPVIFFDELPWLAGKKSDFLEALGYFWNSWASRQNLVIVICGSAASWMIQNVVNNRGGLHNRLTKRIHLEPFTLDETERYLQSRQIHLDRYQITQIYMAMGGIPHYLKEISSGQSAAQIINELCFSKNGLLRDEFLRLYPSLFANAVPHIAVIRALGKHRQGITRQMLVETTNLPAGGSFTKLLEELTYSGFISTYRPFGSKKKEMLYRLTDEYSLFYLHFIESNADEGGNIWKAISQTPAWYAWAGYAFENICLKHIAQIKLILGISGVVTQTTSFYKKGTPEQPGAQIDLVIDRNDRIINLFEIKFYNETFTLTKDYAMQLRRKMSIFREHVKTNKHLSWAFITSFGLVHNQHSLGFIENIITLDDLFAPTKTSH